MGFRYRKSKNLGKGFRVNMSKSGPSFSWGTKGFRLTRTANGRIRGTAYIPGTGLSYQKDFTRASNKKSTSQASKSKATTQKYTTTIKHTNNLNSIHSNDIGDMVEAIRKTKSYNRYSTMAIVAGVVTAFISPFMLILAGLGLIFKIYNKATGKIRVNYDMTDEAKEELEATNHFLAGLLESDAVWLVTELAELEVDHTAQMRMLERVPLTLKINANDLVETNAQTISLEGSASQLLFLPDALIAVQAGQIAGLSFRELEIDLGKMNFIEDEKLPKDATVVGQTYEHVNKDGSPDKRFKENRELPLVEYGVLTLYNKSGLDLVIVFSDTVLDGR